jgi:hypothetical protein
MSNIIEVLRYCSPEVAVYLPSQTDAGTKTAVNELYKNVSKQENAHPEASPSGRGL